MRYFFIKDRVVTGDVELKYCSTTKMLADHFTRPLQGEIFRRFRAELMNIPADTGMTEMGWDGTKAKKGVSWKLHNEPEPACPRECVGDYVKGASMPDASASEVLHTCSPGKEVAGTGSPILDRVTLRNHGKKKSVSDIVRG